MPISPNSRITQFYSSRQKLTLKGDRKALADEVTLEAAGIVDGAELSVKDLGPQVSWTTVFVIEYVSRESRCYHKLTMLPAWPTRATSSVLSLAPDILRWTCPTQQVATVCGLLLFKICQAKAGLCKVCLRASHAAFPEKRIRDAFVSRESVMCAQWA